MSFAQNIYAGTGVVPEDRAIRPFLADGILVRRIAGGSVIPKYSVSRLLFQGREISKILRS